MDKKLHPKTEELLHGITRQVKVAESITDEQIIASGIATLEDMETKFTPTWEEVVRKAGGIIFG